MTTSTPTPAPSKLTLAWRRAELLKHKLVEEVNQLKTDIGTATAKMFVALPNGQNSNAQRARPWHAFSEWNGTSIEFRGFVRLDDFDLIVLLCLVAIANKSGWVIDANNPNIQAIETEMQQQMQLFGATPAQTCVAHISSYQLCQMVCKDTSKGAYKRIAESIVRLQLTLMTINKNDLGFYSSTLIASAGGNTKGQLSISINPLLSKAILGNAKNGNQFIQMDLANLLALNNPTARILYHFLSARVWPKQATTWTLDSLAGQAYPDDETALQTACGPEAITKAKANWREKRKQTRQALSLLNEIEGWTVLVDGSKVRISR